MQAAWLQQLLAAAGRNVEKRPWKGYYAKYAREACPDMRMGRELLYLNLSFGRVTALPPDAIPGEARQAFVALFQAASATILGP